MPPPKTPRHFFSSKCIFISKECQWLFSSQLFHNTGYYDAKKKGEEKLHKNPVLKSSEMAFFWKTFSCFLQAAELMTKYLQSPDVELLTLPVVASGTIMLPHSSLKTKNDKRKCFASASCNPADSNQEVVSHKCCWD